MPAWKSSVSYSLPDLEVSAALGIYKLLKDTGPELQISRKEGSRTDAVAGRTRLTHRLGRGGGNGSPGIVKPGGWIGDEKQEAKAKTEIEVLTASSIPDPGGRAYPVLCCEIRAGFIYSG